MEPIVAPMALDDREAVRRILKDGIATGHASFDTEVPGWAAMSPVSTRCAQSGVAEVSVYVGSRFRGSGPAGAAGEVERDLAGRRTDGTAQQSCGDLVANRGDCAPEHAGSTHLDAGSS